LNHCRFDRLVFNDVHFTKNDDPNEEHDWASFELGGQRFVWTIDLQFG